MTKFSSVTGPASLSYPQVVNKSADNPEPASLLRPFKRSPAIRISTNLKEMELVERPAIYRSRDAVWALQQHKLQVARLALINLGNQRIAQNIMKQEQSLSARRSKASDSEKSAIASKDEHRECLELEKELVDTISQMLRKRGTPSGEAQQIAKSAYKKAGVSIINSRGWTTITNTFTAGEKTYQSTTIPAGKMKWEECDEAIFSTPYKGKGVGSVATTNGSHAGNLWHSHITASGPDGQPVTVYSALRMATLVPYKIKDQVEREQGTLQRGREAILAALFTQPDKLQRALEGETVPLRLASISLMTPGTKGEGTIIKEQIQAWQQLGQGKASPLQLEVRNSQGELQKIMVEVEIVAVNYPVNEMGLKFKMGLKKSDDISQAGLTKLLGPNLQPGAKIEGWVGEYLQTHPKDAEEVRQLAEELKQILTSKAHHSDGGEPYKATKRINLLAQKIGAVSVINCRSGKDRTGMETCETQTEAISRHQNLPPLPPGAALDKAHQQIFQQTLLHSGSLEVQQVNTGAGGNKVIKALPFGSLLNLSYKDRIGDLDIWQEVQGLSPMVKS